MMRRADIQRDSRPASHELFSNPDEKAALEARNGLLQSALFRDRQKDWPAALLKAKQVAEVLSADTLLDRLKNLNRETAEILRDARAKGSRDNELALRAIACAEGQLELEAKLIGALSDSARIPIGVNIGAISDDEQRIAEL
jgi:hypothetical protein